MKKKRYQFTQSRRADLEEVALVREVFLDLLVERLESPLDLARRVQADDFAQLLLAERHLVADLRLLDALAHFGLHAFEEQLWNNENAKQTRILSSSFFYFPRMF